MAENIPDWKHDPEQKQKLISYMIQLLKEGHRMLDETCPRCGAILFLRKDVGLKYCPNCKIFIASPEELEHMDKSKLKIIGEYAGGQIMPLESHQQKITKENEIKINQVKIASLGKRQMESDLLTSFNEYITRILSRISEIADYEIERMSFIELLNALKLLLEIKGLLEGLG